MQKQQIKRQYAKAAKKGGTKAAAEATRKTAKENCRGNKESRRICGKTPGGHFDCSCRAASLYYDFRRAVLLRGMFSGLTNGVLGTSYTSEDSDLVATEQSYAAMENELQSEIDAIESTHSGYDEYRYDLDTIGHNPHELASYLICPFTELHPTKRTGRAKAAVRLTVHLDADGRNRDTHHH